MRRGKRGDGRFLIRFPCHGKCKLSFFGRTLAQIYHRMAARPSVRYTSPLLWAVDGKYRGAVLRLVGHRLFTLAFNYQNTEDMTKITYFFSGISRKLFHETNMTARQTSLGTKLRPLSLTMRPTRLRTLILRTSIRNLIKVSSHDLGKVALCKFSSGTKLGAHKKRNYTYQRKQQK